MQTTAQSWLVVSLTASALKLSLVNVCQFGPVLLLGLYAGVVVDRVAKRTLLILTQSSAAILAGTLAYLDRTGRVQLWQVYLLALAIGVVNAFDMPARQAFVVEMVGKDDLPNAIALNSSLFNAGRLVGPAIAGALLASFGTAVCFALNAISFLPVVVGLILMRVPSQPAKPRGGGLAQLREGLRYVRKTPAVALTVILGWPGRDVRHELCGVDSASCKGGLPNRCRWLRRTHVSARVWLDGWGALACLLWPGSPPALYARHGGDTRYW
ncbi:MAG: hypothetical protein KatS3mg059_1131 [Thermomicrobiales bacterium]|nr:MAG: hypothetical protein KatS3mg059_1131 [Thermomicrobiales bacterium]